MTLVYGPPGFNEGGCDVRHMLWTVILTSCMATKDMHVDAPPATVEPEAPRLKASSTDREPTLDATKGILAQDLTPRVKACFERRLLQVPGLQGRLVVALSVDDGVITEARLDEDTTGDAPLGDCILEQARQVRFQPDLTADLYLPFVLSGS